MPTYLIICTDYLMLSFKTNEFLEVAAKVWCDNFSYIYHLSENQLFYVMDGSLLPRFFYLTHHMHSGCLVINIWLCTSTYVPMYVYLFSMDVIFHTLAATYPILCWDFCHLDLWFEHLTTPRLSYDCDCWYCPHRNGIYHSLNTVYGFLRLLLSTKSVCLCVCPPLRL